MTPSQILVVEDNAMTRKLVRFTLESSGHEVLEAPDGRTALELVESEHPALVLQDIRLPDVDGLELPARLKRSGGSHPARVVAYSGFVSELDHAQISRAGFDDVVAKPVELRRLVEIVNGLLALHAAQPEAFGRGRLLVVADDNPLQLKILRFRMERLGFRLKVAADGKDALAIARLCQPDGVISDILMPRLDGFGLAHALRREEALKDVPILLVTSTYVDPAVRELALKSGATNLVVRTPTLDQLTAALRDALEESGPRKQPADALDGPGSPERQATILPPFTDAPLPTPDETARVDPRMLVTHQLASVGTLAAGIAHEINNPLAAVLSNLELAERDLQEAAEGFGDLRAVPALVHDARVASERIRQIVQDLRVAARPPDERCGPTDVLEVLEASLRIAWSQIRYRARLVKEFGPVPRVAANDSRLGQVFLNLIVNAAQAIPEGAAEHNEVRIKADVAGEYVRVSVTDTGEGIPPDILHRIGTPFYTTKTAGTGTGLGLSICKQILEQIGGHLEIDSRVGFGSTFSVLLVPVRDSENPLPPEAMPTVVPQRRAEILVIDDDPQVATAVSRTLRKDQHEVTEMRTADAALEAIQKGRWFDLIICELMMPQMSGMAFLEELAGWSRELADRVVFLVGTCTKDAHDFLKRVGNPRLEKPFEASQLRCLINERVNLDPHGRRLSGP